MALSTELLAADPVKIRIEGVDGDARKNVESALVLPPGFIKDGKVEKLWLEHFSRQAETKVKEALEPFGYYEAQISSSLKGNDQEGYQLDVKVTTGALTRINSLEINLAGPGGSEVLLREKVAAFPLRVGDPMLHGVYENAKEDLLAKARELGYLDAVFQVHQIQVDPATTSASISLLLESGPRFLFGDTKIEGATYYPEELLRRFIAFSKGEPFSAKKLAETQLNFASSIYFKSVSVIIDKQAATDLLVPVRIQVVPSSRRTIRTGIGYGTDTGFRGSIGYKDLTLFKPGNTLNLELTAAERFQGVGTAYSMPSSKNMDTVTTLQINVQREDVNDTLSKLVSLELDRSSGFGNNRIGTVFLRFQYEQYRAGLQDSDSLLLLPGLRFSQRKYNDLIRPTQGYTLLLETRGTHRMLGSDLSFIQFIAEAGGIMELPWRLSLKGRVKGATTILDDPFGKLPISLRFFAGGDTSVRGYSYKSLGPKDASGEVIGGRNLLQGGIEIERALFDNWGISLFYDAGNAFDESQDFKLFQGAGVGLCYYTPIGAVNLSIARQIAVADPGYKVHFTIGLQF